MKLFLTFLAAVFAAAVYNYSVEALGVPSEHGFLGGNTKDLYFLPLILLMLIGIAFGSLYRQVRDSESYPGFLGALQEMFSGRDFLLSILVSPIVFWGFYQVTKENPLSASSLFIAFQNGFFCQSIFENNSSKADE